MSAIDLRRSTYMSLGQNSKKQSLDYYSSKYKNIKHLLRPSQAYSLTLADYANAPGLAFKFYGDVGYWWVICLYNGIIDPITGFQPGNTIYLPSLADVNALLSSQDDTILASSTVTI